MIKILIMDDEPALRNIVYNMVKPLGHQLFTAEDGRQAIEIAQREIPNMALLDMRVPDMDGLEVLAELRKINPDIKCIMLSGFGDVETAVTAIKLGAFDYVSKPFKIDEVLKVVNKAISTMGQSVSQPVAVAAAVPAAQSSSAAKPAPAAAAAAGAVKKGGSKNLGIGIAAAALLAVAGLSVFFFAGKKTAAGYAVPYANPTGMCWIQPNLWVSDWVMGNIYKHTVDSKLSIAAVYKIANAQPSGVTYDGAALWTCNSTEQRIYKHAMDEALSVTQIYATAGNNPSGLYFDGANLWVLDSDNGKIYKHKMDESLSVIAVYDSPALNPCGMFRSGDYFYIADYKTSNIYKVAANDLSISEVLRIPLKNDASHKLIGITWDGKNIWASLENESKLYQFPVSALTLVKF